MTGNPFIKISNAVIPRDEKTEREYLLMKFQRYTVPVFHILDCQKLKICEYLISRTTNISESLNQCYKQR